jgi:signal transduction histidine kinase
MEAGEPADERERVDIAAAAREAADSVASRAEQAGIELELAIAETPLVVAAERSRLQTVLGNLLDNAIKFTPEGGSVTLGVQPEGGAAVVTVADTGVGIPADAQSGIFGRFHRARNVSAYPGNGLGLAIVKAAVERSGGTVSFTSSEAGTEFRVSLPLA